MEKETRSGLELRWRDFIVKVRGAAAVLAVLLLAGAAVYLLPYR